uniref:Uncharacterized protein n=1 Tax=Anguilla anguilla TaxID=7936 RepID=A0A0E9VGC1_ANGAN
MTMTVKHFYFTTSDTLKNNLIYRFCTQP